MPTWAGLPMCGHPSDSYALRAVDATQAAIDGIIQVRVFALALAPYSFG